jgi:hypothetical protein
MAVGVFAGIPVRDYGSALEWYKRLLGAEPAFFPNDLEAVWQLAEDRYVYIVQDPDRAGGAVSMIWVDDPVQEAPPRRLPCAQPNPVQSRPARALCCTIGLKRACRQVSRPALLTASVLRSVIPLRGAGPGHGQGLPGQTRPGE